MKLEVAIVVVLCVLGLVESNVVGGKKRPLSLSDSYFLDRLEVTDKTLLTLIKRVEALENAKPGCPDKYKGWTVVFDFEKGRTGWTLTGTAFNNQPTYGDNPAGRSRGRQHSKHVGNWWIGDYENCPSPAAKTGAIQGDKPQGTMTSPVFKIRGNKLRFLIGGSCDIKTVRAELVVDGKVVTRSTGRCNESMVKKEWDVSGYVGKTAQLRLVDNSSGRWGHINFDQLEEFCA